MPTVIANELVGVQPMTGPVGQIHTLRVRYADAFDDVTAGEEAIIVPKLVLVIQVVELIKLMPTATLEGAAGKRLRPDLKANSSSKPESYQLDGLLKRSQDAQAPTGH